MSVNYRDPISGSLTRLDNGNIILDSAPTAGSNRPVSSGGVYTAEIGKTNLTNIATVEASTTASQAYASGDLLILGGQLYKADSAIAQNGTIYTEGANKNVSPTTIADNLGGDTSNLMQKGVDYVTAGKKSGSTLGTKATAEGDSTVASGDAAHAEGRETTASGSYSHTGGEGTIAQRQSQTVIGEYNIADTGGANENARGDYAFIVGNGTDNNTRSNAMTVSWEGDVADGKGNVLSKKANKAFMGTQAEWTAEQHKSDYQTVCITDDVTNAIVDQTPTSGSQHLVTSGGVYSALQNVSGDVFTGATRDTNGTNGLVPGPTSDYEIYSKVLRGSGLWSANGIVQTTPISYGYFIGYTSSPESYSASTTPNAVGINFSFVDNISAAYTSPMSLLNFDDKMWIPSNGGVKSFRSNTFNKTYSIHPHSSQRLVLYKFYIGDKRARVSPSSSYSSVEVLFLTDNMIRKISDSVTSFGGLYHHSISLVLNSPEEYDYNASGGEEIFTNSKGKKDYYIGYEMYINCKGLVMNDSR